MNQILESIDKSLSNLENLKDLQNQRVKELNTCKGVLDILQDATQISVLSPKAAHHFKINDLKCFPLIEKMIRQEFELKAEEIIYKIENFVNHNVNQ